MGKKEILIGGKFVSGDGEFDVNSPFDGELISHVSSATLPKVFDVLSHAETAARSMRRVPRYQLREALERISNGISDRKNEFAETIAKESAKPIRYARVEVDRAVSTFRIAAAEAERFAGEAVPVDLNASATRRNAYTTHIPRGVIFGITPFNYPLNLVAHKVAPALASGNAIIIKPSDKTPLTSLLLGEVFLECGLPAGALQIVPMELDVLHQVLQDERVAMISFTGSDTVGWMLKERYSRKAIALELGGNAPVIVDESADLVDASERIAAGAFSYSGQVCISVQRILVNGELRDELVERVKEHASQLVRGNPLDEETGISTMISKQAAEKAIGIVNEAQSQGAEVIFGGGIEGAFIEPALVGKVDPEMRIVADEIFAPVATVEVFTDFAQAIELANQSRFGLQAGVFSNSLKNVEFAARELEYGGVLINDVPTFRVDNMPYGGIKDSGSGREGVRFAMEEMCEKKIIVTRVQ